jgi:hypothetical protein
MGVWVDASRHNILASCINDFGTFRRLQTVKGDKGYDNVQSVEG